MVQAGLHSTNNVIKIGEVDLNQLRNDIQDIPKQRQYPLQGTSKEDFDSSLSNDINLRDNETDYVYRLYDNLDYTYSLIEQYKLYRARYMFLPSITCYGYHKDNTPRIHIPIETNENCFFVLDDKVVRLPADGSVYWVDTRLSHTFVNSNTHKSDFVRSHLVANTMLNESEIHSLADRLL